MKDLGARLEKLYRKFKNTLSEKTVYREGIAMVQRARIRLLSTSVESLRSITEELHNISEKAGIDMKGPIPFPTRKVIIPVRKSPCGNGTQTWEHYEMKIHKRLIDLDADEKAMHLLMRLNVPDDIRIEVELA